MRRALAMCTLLACASDPATLTRATWGGLYRVSVVATVAPRMGMSQTLTGVESWTASQTGERLVWSRPDGCVTSWRIDGETAVADRGESCSGRGVTLTLDTGVATRTGGVVRSTWRWTWPGGAVVEDATAELR